MQLTLTVLVRQVDPSRKTMQKASLVPEVLPARGWVRVRVGVRVSMQKASLVPEVLPGGW